METIWLYARPHVQARILAKTSACTSRRSYPSSPNAHLHVEALMLARARTCTCGRVCDTSTYTCRREPWLRCAPTRAGAYFCRTFRGLPLRRFSNQTVLSNRWGAGGISFHPISPFGGMGGSVRAVSASPLINLERNAPPFLPPSIPLAL